MEETIETRYTFMMMLAISDATGHVIGTDVAIARRINMPAPLFIRCVKRLQLPDEDSNSKEEEGRRLIPSQGERGYKIVNYQSYRDIRDEDERREYMRTYMQQYRAKKRPALADVNNSKEQLLLLANAEGEGEEEVDGEEKAKGLRSRKDNAKTPYLSEAIAYGADIGMSSEEVKSWFDHFESNGWKVSGKTPMKDWKAAMRNGKRYAQTFSTPKNGKPSRATAPIYREDERL